MMLPQLLALSLALAPNLVNAAIFPKDTLVKMLDHKGFKQAMKENVRNDTTQLNSTCPDILHPDDLCCCVCCAMVWPLPKNGTGI